MNLLSKLRHALLGKAQPKVTRLEAPDGVGCGLMSCRRSR
jgi:hypothetical protein